MAGDFDKRITPARADLAAARLKGVVDAPRYAEGVPRMALRGHTPLRAKPESYAAQETEILFGEVFTVYEQKDGWVLLPGEYTILVGGSSDKLPLKATVTLK